MSAPAARGERWFILLLGLVYLFNAIDRTAISVLGEPIRRELGLDDFELGLLGGLSFSLFYATLGIPLARLAERQERVRLIVVVTAIWSAMTALSGAAGSFVQLVACRIGVATGEAGFTPALVSMLSDRFPPGRRAAAFSMIAMGVPVGSALAAVGGGLIAGALGWRATFVALGLPGLALALLVRLTIREPERDAGDAAAPPMSEVARRLARSPAFLHLTAGSGLVGLVGFGLNLFLIPLLVRRYGLSLPQAGTIFAVSSSGAVALGMAAGGHVADALGRRDRRWHGRAPALLVAVAAPLYGAALLQDDWRALMLLMFLASAALYAFMPAIMTVTQQLVEPRMRASAAAIHSFGQTVLGLGIGSVLLGFLSDRLAAGAFAGDYRAHCLGLAGQARAPACVAAAASGLQHALLTLVLALAWAVGHYLLAGSALGRPPADRVPAAAIRTA